MDKINLNITSDQQVQAENQNEIIAASFSQDQSHAHFPDQLATHLPETHIQATDQWPETRLPGDQQTVGPFSETDRPGQDPDTEPGRDLDVEPGRDHDVGPDRDLDVEAGRDPSNPNNNPVIDSLSLSGSIETIAKLRNLALELPNSPGVYLMKDSKGNIIYVGKAKVLPKRVSSYFRDKSLSPRISLMVNKIESFDFMVTGTEKEALILENNLIKKHRPRFNVILRDDKTYPSIRLSNTDPFPRLETVRRPVRDGSIIFGPFPSASSLKETIRMVNRLFPLRKCKRPEVKKIDRPCLNYQIGQCTGPCRPEVTPEEYKLLTDQVRLFFMGRQGELIKQLENEMKAAAEIYDYEKAATIRDRLADVRKTLEHQVVALNEDKDLDFWSLATKDGIIQAVVLTVRSGVVSGCRPLSVEGEEQEKEILASLIGQFYRLGDFIPNEVCLPYLPPQAETVLLTDYLSGLKGSSIKIHTPTRGQRLKLLEMASENAKAILEERIEKLTLTKGVMAELMAKLSLPTIPKRLECFDLAHIQGTSNVAGMIVMENGEWKKSQYRKFKIKEAPGGDDYAGMREVIRRRFRLDREGQAWPVPDLLLIDGGRGQLTSVLAAFDDLGITPPPMAGITKDRQDHGPDRIFLPGRKNPADLKPGSAALMFLAKLRDEAHRFCRTYHHQLRSKEMLSSVLLEVKGLGQVRLKALSARFATLEELNEASDEDIIAVTSLSKTSVNDLKAKVRTILKSHD
ncbi:MAG: excinuclease ABC subunit UvrC, partial [Deltaproteobacteria bacterium]|nr:excinuclease ABC subunit UvrC [Deltaproteobacteria bacterium]